MTRFPVQGPIDRATDEQIQQALVDPGFGKFYVDHVAKAIWTPDQGWHDHQMAAVADISMHPSAAVLHYAQEIFEGLKAYRHDDGTVWLFRPEQAAMPPLPSFRWMFQIVRKAHSRGMECGSANFRWMGRDP